MQVAKSSATILVSMPATNSLRMIHLLLVICLLGVASSTQFDGTLKEGESGINVVIAVIEKINASQVFDVPRSLWYDIDGQRALVKQFMRYKAFVETEYGENLNGTGGIWRVTEEQFNDTIAYVRDNGHLRSRMIKSVLLQIDWLNVSYADISIPIYSGLATMLRLDQLIQEETIDLLTENGLAGVWVRHFGGNGIHKWLNGTTYLINHIQQSKITIN